MLPWVKLESNNDKESIVEADPFLHPMIKGTIYFFRAKVCGLLTNSISEKFPEKKKQARKKKTARFVFFFFFLCQSLQRTN